MPGRKKKDDTVETIPVEETETQQQAFDRLSTNLTSTFEKGFEKLQQALLNMATPAPVPAAEPQHPKRTADDGIEGPNTRNKALRQVYNPPNKKGKDTNTQKGKAKASCTQSQAQRELDATNEEQPDVTHIGATSGSHLAFANVNNNTNTTVERLCDEPVAH